MEVYDANGYRQWIRGWLDRLSPALESQLRTILSCRFHPRVILLDIEVFPTGLQDGIPMRMFLIDARNGEEFHDDPAYFLPTSIGLLDEIKEAIPSGEAERRKGYEDAGVATLEVEMATLVEWFVACWIQADGPHFRLPAYIGYHDDRESFDLQQMRWAPNVQGKWSHFTQE